MGAIVVNFERIVDSARRIDGKKGKGQYFDHFHTHIVHTAGDLSVGLL
jgi:hypothetical protein